MVRDAEQSKNKKFHGGRYGAKRMTGAVTWNNMDAQYDLEHTFVTSDHHFCLWNSQIGRILGRGSVAEDERHIELWNSVVGKDDLVLYVGDYCDGPAPMMKDVNNLLNGRKVLIKGNHDGLSDECYREIFSDVVSELRIEELNLRLIHSREEVKDLRSGERLIYGHEHRNLEGVPDTAADSICVCAQWHDWKPISLAEAFRQMNSIPIAI
jgi:calcineurin-like phosphoesterase family protein